MLFDDLPLFTVSNVLVRSTNVTYSPVFIRALLLELPENKHNVGGALNFEATLARWKVFFSDVGYQSVQQNPCKDSFYDGKQSNPSIIGVVRFFLFLNRVMMTAS